MTTARALPTMPNWLAGQKLTAAALNQITTFNNFWADPPTFSMYQTVTQNCTTGTDNQITCDSISGSIGWDSDGGRAAGTPWNWTVPAGWGSNLRMTFEFCVGWTSSATGTRWSYLKQNGAIVNSTRFQYPGGGDPVFVGGTRSITVSGGDVIGLWGGQSSGGTLATTTINSCSFLAGWLRGTGNP